MKNVWRGLACLSLLVGLGCAVGIPAPIKDLPPGPEIVIQPVRLPGGGKAAHALMHRGLLHVVYFLGEKGNADVYYARSNTGGDSFSAPVKLNRTPAALARPGVGPQIGVDEDGQAYVAWGGAGRKGGSAVWYARSDRAGAFAAPQVLHETPDRLNSAVGIAATCNTAHVFWSAPDDAGGHRVWMVESRDNGVTFAKATPISPVGSVVGSGTVFAQMIYPGTPLVLFRASSKPEIWQQFALRYSMRKSDFEVARLDEWDGDACPATTAAVTHVANGYLVAWETKGQIHYARSSLQGAKFGRPVTATGAGGKRQYPAIAHDGARTALVWIETNGATTEARWELYDNADRPVGKSGAIKGVPDAPVNVFSYQAGQFRLLY